MLGGVSLLSDSNRSQIIPGLESSQKTRHKKSASNVEDITRSQRVKDQSPAPARPNKASTQPSHRRIRSTHVSPIRSAAVEVSAMLPTGAVNTGKHVDNFGRVTNDNTIKEGSRRFSDRQKDLRALMKALHAQQIQNQRKIHKNYLQRRERGDVSVLANISQENVQNNSVITPKIAHNDDHSQLFDAKTKSLQKRTDQLDFSSRQKILLIQKHSHAPEIRIASLIPFVSNYLWRDVCWCTALLVDCLAFFYKSTDTKIA